ncbi:MAG: hypothetical protein PHF37_04405 [Phycisphaerae bacterium]|nr:hypothetical protein [Phycisphaerae bacterium]
MENSQLNARQRRIIKALLEGKLDEDAILKRCEVSRATYDLWFDNELFRAELGKRLAAIRRRNEARLEVFMATAAAKLVQLTESKNQETARKACLDIIKMNTASKQKCTDKNDKKRQETHSLDPETAKKLSKFLIEEKEKGNFGGQYEKVACTVPLTRKLLHQMSPSRR